jgi:hypothetical protein
MDSHHETYDAEGQKANLEYKILNQPLQLIKSGITSSSLEKKNGNCRTQKETRLETWVK